MRILKAVTVGTIVLATPLLAAGTAGAQYGEPDGPVAVRGPVNPGASVEVEMCCVAPFSMVEVVVASTPTVVGHLQADAEGRVRGSVTLPTNLGTGQHTVTVSGVDSAGEPVVYSSPIVVDGSDGSSLPRTGAAVAGLVVSGLSLVGVGTALNRAARRRR